MKNVRFASAALMLVTGLISAACSAHVSTPTSPSAIAGAGATLTEGAYAGTWQLTDIQPTGQAAQPAPEGATYRITFEDGRVSTRADCNVCSGSATLSGQAVTIGPALACTRAACPTMAYETVYESILSGNSSVTVTDRSLTLSSTRGVLRFTR